MRLALLAPIALVTLAGCAATSGSSGSLLLQPGSRAHGEVHIPAGSATTVKLANRGPGRADFVIRQDGGGVLADGLLDKAETRTESSDPVVLIVVVEAYDDARTDVSWRVMSENGAKVRWTLDGESAVGTNP